MLGWNQFQYCNFRETIEPERVDCPPDSAGNEDIHSTGRSFQTAGVSLVSDRKNRGSYERDTHLSAVGMTRNHQANSRCELRISCVWVVRKYDTAIRFWYSVHQSVEAPVVFPEVTCSGQPEPASVSVDRSSFVPQVLASLVQPVLGATCIRPVVVIAEH